jgi:hypothetical protein
VLGIKPDASTVDIKAAYRDLGAPRIHTQSTPVRMLWPQPASPSQGC